MCVFVFVILGEGTARIFDWVLPGATAKTVIIANFVFWIYSCMQCNWGRALLPRQFMGGWHSRATPIQLTPVWRLRDQKESCLLVTTSFCRRAKCAFSSLSFWERHCQNFCWLFVQVFPVCFVPRWTLPCLLCYDLFMGTPITLFIFVLDHDVSYVVPTVILNLFFPHLFYFLLRFSQIVKLDNHVVTS